MVCVGIDVAKDKHDCFILSSEGEVLADVFTIANNREGFETLLRTIRSCSGPTDNIKIGLEATGHYSYNILGSFVRLRPTGSTHGRLHLCSCLMWTSSPTQTQHTIMKS